MNIIPSSPDLGKLYVKDSRREYEIKYAVYPGGEVRLETEFMTILVGNTPIIVTAHLESSNDIMALAMLVDSLRRKGNTNIRLSIPYFPYARQDRTGGGAANQALGAKVMADIINSMGFDRVYITDPHSDVTSALVSNVVTVPAHYDLVNQVTYDCIIIPDVGAVKKIYPVAQAVELPYIMMRKKRDEVTGAISGFELSQEDARAIDGKRVIILDDICDGGGTFRGIASAIKASYAKPTYLGLYVTHGIFSQGFEGLLEDFDSVKCNYAFVEALKSALVLDSNKFYVHATGKLLSVTRNTPL